MAILFTVTVLVVGPAWCSHLCYFGAHDGLAAARRRRPARLPHWTVPIRGAILVTVPAVAVTLRALGVGGTPAALWGVGFGIAGLGVMLLFSRRLGTMAHCMVWCPLGWLANALGKIAPFRVRIGTGCDECHACSRACRYGALHAEHIARRQPGFNCTLCGDCVKACSKTEIGYRLGRLSPETARATFLTLAVALHACCLGVARI
jgi:polyferredoxin